jgi:PadR family transcriptional regulator PadR
VDERAVDQTQLLKGVLDLAVLVVLDRDDSYGYDVVRQLHGAALAEIAEASVYGTLRRLYRSGLLTSYVVASDAGPHRKYYGLTGAGRRHLKQAREEWLQFAGAMNSLVGA